MNKWCLIKKGLILIVLQGVIVGTDISANQVKVYNIKNTKTGEVLLTSNENEYKTLVSESKSWTNTNNIMKEFNVEEINTSPVYRLFNPQTGEHFYTTSRNELEELLTEKGWIDEGVSFYSPNTGKVPVYRFFKSGNAHRFTSNHQEESQLLQSGWSFEGIAWYQTSMKSSVEGRASQQVTSYGSYALTDVPVGFQLLESPARIVQYPKTGSYPWGQCTWYTYYRAQELGIHFSTQMGNGGAWQYAPGYEVSHTPRAGSALSFSPGEAGADSTYGHVAFVEQVRNDGSILVSECNVQGLGVLSYRTFTAEEAQHFHYVRGKQ